MSDVLRSFSQVGWEQLAAEDPVLFDLLEREHRRQGEVLSMVASASIAEPSALFCEGTVGVNVTAEGYPRKRFHGGCRFVDEIEQLAIDRAKAAFAARYANVQLHSATTANQVIMFGILEPGDIILGLELRHGGHLSHGSKSSVAGKCFHAISYRIDESGLIDYEGVRALAIEHRPRLLICGATAYPRIIDFQQFRRIADEVGSFLLADITHIAGLVAAGLHPSPIDHAHFTTTCTHKQLYGPRGGLILMGRDCDIRGPGGEASLSALVQRGVFPLLQGAPSPNSMAAKACCLARLVTPEFRMLAERIVSCSRSLAKALQHHNYRVVGGGSDNHIVLVDLGRDWISGLVAEKALEESNVVVNRNTVPADHRRPRITSGIRLGTNALARRSMGPAEMETCAGLIDQVLRATRARGDLDYELDPFVRDRVRTAVKSLCNRFPIPRYTT